MTKRRKRQRPVQTERQVLAEASSPALDMVTGAIDDDDHLYRPLTSSRGNNLPQHTQDKILRVSRYLARVNPVANRLLTLISDFVLGEGVEVSGASAAVQDVVTQHWADRYNAWDRESPARMRRFFKTGEYLMPLFINPVNGDVRVGSILPDRIKTVHTDPENWESVTAVELKPVTGQTEGVRYTVVNDFSADELAGVERPALWWSYGNDDGERGISLLYPIADYLDALDQFMFSEVERWLLLKAFVWDVTIKGATQDTINEMVKRGDFRTPTPSEVIVHNDTTEWQAKSPQLDTHDAANGIRLVRNHALGAVGIPEHWYAEGGDVNRATATEMAEAPRKRLTALQEIWRNMMLDLLHVVVEYKVLFGQIPAELPTEDEDGNPHDEATPARGHVEVSMPDLSPDDQEVMAGVLSSLVASLMQAEDQGYVSRETSQRTVLMTLQQMGVDFDIEAEKVRIQADQNSRDAERQQDVQRLYQKQPPLAVVPPQGNERESGD